jgi:hypothetical protein
VRLLTFFRFAFTLNPLAHEWSTIEQVAALRFASAQEAHRLHVQIRNFGEIDSDGTLRAVFQLRPKGAQMF